MQTNDWLAEKNGGKLKINQKLQSMCNMHRRMSEFIYKIENN